MRLMTAFLPLSKHHALAKISPPLTVALMTNTLLLSSLPADSFFRSSAFQTYLGIPEALSYAPGVLEDHFRTLVPY